MSTVIAVVDDLFFASKIRGTAEQSGVSVIFAKSIDQVVQSVTETGAGLIIADLHSQRVDPVQLATRLKADEQLKSIPLIGFFSHVQVELQQAAKAAGFDQVLPRSAFVNQLGAILSNPQITQK